MITDHSRGALEALALDVGKQTVLHEMRQTLRVTGVPRVLLELASLAGGLEAFWAAARPNVGTRAFEDASDRLRDEAVHAAARMDRLSVLGLAQLGESQAFQAEAALMLRHYLDPRLLLLAAMAAGALDTPGAPPARGAGSAEPVERGVPARMPPLEHADEHLAEDETRKILREARRALGAAETPEDLLALALWPRYLRAAWQRLKPVVKTAAWTQTADRLASLARELSRTLPHPAAPALLRDGDGVAARLAEAQALELRLGRQTLAVAMLALDWQAPELARRSPYPAAPRAASEAL